MIGKNKTTTPFEPHEKRALKLDKTKLDPKYLVSGKVPSIEAEHRQTDSRAWGDARHYRMMNKSGRIPVIRIQLNHGDLKDDEKRLTAIAEDILSPKPELAELEPKAI